MDGWGKLVKEIGDLFYYNVARTYLWGGLYELNYEYSPMEALDGRETDPQEHYFHFEPQGYAYDRNRAAYLGPLARRADRRCQPYWSYGLVAAQASAAHQSHSWYHYNHDKHSPAYQAGGAPAPAVVGSLYRDEHGGLPVSGEHRGKPQHPARMEDICPGWKRLQAVLLPL